MRHLIGKRAPQDPFHNVPKGVHGKRVEFRKEEPQRYQSSQGEHLAPGAGSTRSYLPNNEDK